MNERIKQLAIEAKLIASEPNGFDQNNLSKAQQKFAELIIQECGDVAYGTYWKDPKGVRGIHIKDAILENFGVE